MVRRKAWASPVTNPREVPRYSIPEAAAYLQMPKSTLAYWVAGWSGSVPLIHRPDPEDARLSFSNLIEAHVLRALRVQQEVKMRAVREALDYAEERFGIDRLLLHPELRSTPGEIFLEHLGQLINLGRRGQEAMKDILERFLVRIDRDALGSPVRLFPLTRPDRLDAPRVVAIDPAIASGRPVTVRKAIRTSTIAERFDVGESVSDIATDYGLKASEVEEAIRYERRYRLAA